MEITFTLAVLVAAVVGLVEVVKKIGLPSRFLPVAAIVLGVGLSMLAVLGNMADASYAEAAFGGLIAGLSAVGLYSGTKNTAKSKS
jgi:hypothetical protein